MSPAIFTYQIVVPPGAIDQNGHVNNVVFVQWMQDAAVRHFNAAGGEEPMREAGGAWVVRSHKIEYFSPAHAGDQIEIRTWIASFERVRSVRRYEFERLSDAKILVRGETDWVFVDAQRGRPMPIPDVLRQKFELLH